MTEIQKEIKKEPSEKLEDVEKYMQTAPYAPQGLGSFSKPSSAMPNATQFTQGLTDAILRLFRNRRLMNSLGVALIALSGFIEKQTQNEHLPKEQQQAIVQIGTLGWTAFRMDVKKGSVWDKLTPTQLKGVFAESFKEFMGNLSRKGDNFDFRLYDDNVNMTPEEKDKRDGKVLYEPFVENPIKEYKERRNAFQKASSSGSEGQSDTEEAGKALGRSHAEKVFNGPRVPRSGGRD